MECFESGLVRLDSFQYRSLRRLLRFRAVEHISYASIIHTCRSTGVHIMPISMMISKRRLSLWSCMSNGLLSITENYAALTAIR